MRARMREAGEVIEVPGKLRPRIPYGAEQLGGHAIARSRAQPHRQSRPALERHAPAEVLEDAEIEATIAGHDEWAQTGRAGARSHDDVMAELLAGR